MAEHGLDGLLMFRQESMYYLTGYDTFGYVFFQCLYLGADGTMTLLTRAPDLRQARHTSVIEDIRLRVDAEDADPARQLRGILEEHGCRGRRLGVEWEAYGLTARNGQRLTAALEGFCALEDASELVSRLRVVKSPAELAYVRRAAELADDALDEANRLAQPGAFEGDILAAMHAAVFRGDGAPHSAGDPANFLRRRLQGPIRSANAKKVTVVTFSSRRQTRRRRNSSECPCSVLSRFDWISNN